MSSGDNLHEMSQPIFWKKILKYFKKSSVEIFTQSAKGLQVLEKTQKKYECIASKSTIPMKKTMTLKV